MIGKSTTKIFVGPATVAITDSREIPLLQSVHAITAARTARQLGKFDDQPVTAWPIPEMIRLSRRTRAFHRGRQRSVMEPLRGEDLREAGPYDSGADGAVAGWAGYSSGRCSRR